MAAPRAVALLTDFGHADPFVGIMKGVILDRAPNARVVDLCHGIAAQDVEAGALALRASVPHFPPRTLFVAVVDPGVGSSRRVLLAQSSNHLFLAPDNGILSWLAEGDSIVGVRHVTNDTYFRKPVSTTFQGRDIFAPLAGALLNGITPASLGPAVNDIVRLPWPKPRRAGSAVEGRILSFDHFGNAITTLTPSDVPPRAHLVHRGRDVGPLRTHYAEVPNGKTLAVAGSSGLVELSERGGDYAARTRARKGDTVHVRHRR